VRKKQRPAYTLLEIVLVLAVLVVVAALAVPVIDSIQAGPRLTAARDVIQSRLLDCRTHAIEDRRPYRFAFREGTGDFKIAPDTTEYWPDDALGGPSADPEDSSWVVESSLPVGVTFSLAEGSSVGGSGDWRTLVTFLADGTAKDDVEITLNTHGAPPSTIRLRGNTGMITTASLPTALRVQ